MLHFAFCTVGVRGHDPQMLFHRVRFVCPNFNLYESCVIPLLKHYIQITRLEEYFNTQIL